LKPSETGKFCNNSIDQRVGLMVYSKNQSARAAGCAGEYAAGGEPEAVFTVMPRERRLRAVRVAAC
jgi:hypothetical protein